MVANPARGQLNRETKYFPVPRSRLKIWSRKRGSAAPSSASLLNSPYSDCIWCLPTGSSPSHDGVRLYTVHRHWVHAEFATLGNRVLMAFTAESQPTQDHTCPKGSPRNWCCSSGITMDQSMCAPHFPHPLFNSIGHLFVNTRRYWRKCFEN